jgi:hypothetical protein
VSAILERVKLAVLDAALQRLGEAGRGHRVVAAEGDLGRGGDLAELAESVVSDDRVRLADEGVEWLLRTAVSS